MPYATAGQSLGTSHIVECGYVQFDCMSVLRICIGTVYIDKNVFIFSSIVYRFLCGVCCVCIHWNIMIHNDNDNNDNDNNDNDNSTNMVSNRYTKRKPLTRNVNTAFGVCDFNFCTQSILLVHVTV